MLKVSDIASAIAEHDFAKRAASYGGNPRVSRSILQHAVANLPQPELVEVRAAIARACERAVKRTEERLTSLGVVLDVDHPFACRAGAQDPD